MGARDGEFASLIAYSGDALVSITVMLLITIGGIGFLVWDDLIAKKFNFKKLELHTKLVLVTSFILTFGGAILVFFLERGSFSGMPLGERILSSLFASVTTRTAGFNTTDIAKYTGGTKLLMVILMFVGGSPGSTAGGIKTTTVAILFINMAARMRRLPGTVAFGREIDQSDLGKAATIFVVNLTLALSGTLAICLIQDINVIDLMFEVFSAIGTVGMTTGITRSLAAASKYIVMFLMYCGRVGSISFALALLEKKGAGNVKYPKGKITIG